MENLANKQALEAFFHRYDLQDWWHSGFSPQQRKYISDKIKTLYIDSSDSTEEDYQHPHQSVVGFLAEIADAFRRPPEREIANQILDKAEDLYWKGLKIDKELGRKKGVADKYGGLGEVYELVMKSIQKDSKI